jgi:hypothetical protein
MEQQCDALEELAIGATSFQFKDVFELTHFDEAPIKRLSKLTAAKSRSQYE